MFIRAINIEHFIIKTPYLLILRQYFTQTSLLILSEPSFSILNKAQIIFMAIAF